MSPCFFMSPNVTQLNHQKCLKKHGNFWLHVMINHDIKPIHRGRVQIHNPNSLYYDDMGLFLIELFDILGLTFRIGTSLLKYMYIEIL